MGNSKFNRALSGERINLTKNYVLKTLIKKNIIDRTCQKCNKENISKLYLNYKDGDDLNNTLSNLMIICEDCYYISIKKDREIKIIICEKCGKECEDTYGSGRFCSQECARSFSSNTNREETNKKVSDTFRKKYEGTTKNKNKIRCNHCNKTFESSNKLKHCNECSKYFKKISMYKKLSVYDENLNLIEINKLALDKLINLYFIQKKSTLDIYKEYKIDWVCVRNFFKNNNIWLRNHSESHNNYMSNNKPKCINHHNNNQYKAGKHITWDNKEVLYRSSYELLFMKELDENKILYEVEFKYIPYYDSIKKKNRFACPDFYIPHLNKIIEIKSDWTYKNKEQEMEDKINEYKNLGYNAQLIVISNVNEIYNHI